MVMACYFHLHLFAPVQQVAIEIMLNTPTC